MKPNKYKIVSVVICAIVMLTALWGCKKDVLANSDKANLTETTQWADQANADIFLNDVYNNLPDLYNSPENLDNFTDDNDAGIYYSSWTFKQGNIDATSTYYSIWGSACGVADLNRFNWTDDYTTIRKCNTFLAEVNKYKSNFPSSWYNQRVDEVRYLRAFYYSLLFLHIGGVPIITGPQNRTDTATLDVPRSTYAQTLEFLTTSLDTVVKDGYLPVKYGPNDPGAGRATLGAAQMLKAWLELIAASPAYNASTPAAGTDPHNVAGMGNYDAKRWATAAADFKYFIDNWGDGKNYALFPDETTLWTTANKYNSEVIFDRQSVANITGNIFEQYGGPVYVLGNYETWGNYDPTQELVDQFFMANGKPITDPTSGYDPQHPYVGREPRFYDWIVYDGAPYYLQWMPKADTIYTRIDKVHPSQNQIDFGSNDVGNTGYYFKKKLDPTVRPGVSSGQNFIYFRYAEVLLGYAEAQNEASGPDATVYAAINQIRARAGLPGLAGGLSQDQMRAAIHQERRVELCFENRRFYDMIRWKEAMTVMNVDKHAMEITNSSPNDDKGVWQYTVIPLNHPHTFLQKMYLDPIPQPVLAQNPKLVQNPGY